MSHAGSREGHGWANFGFAIHTASNRSLKQWACLEGGGLSPRRVVRNLRLDSLILWLVTPFLGVK